MAIDEYSGDSEWSIVAVTKIAVLKGIHYSASTYDQFEAKVVKKLRRRIKARQNQKDRE